MDAPFFISGIEVLDSGDILLSYIPAAGENLSATPSCYRLFIADNNLKIKKKLFPFEKGYHDPVGRWNYFTRDGDRIVFSSFYFDGFTLIDSGTGDYQHISIVFDKPVPDRFRQDTESIQSLIFGLTGFVFDQGGFAC